MRDLIDNFYHVWLDRELPKPLLAAWTLEQLADALPHGSGFDSSWTIVPRRDRGLTLRTEWHAMNGDGYYVGYRPVVVVIRPEMNVQDAAGIPDRWSVARVRVRETDTCGYGLGDYIAEVVGDALRNLRTVQAAALKAGA